MKARMTPESTALLLVDHQSGLFQTVKDIDIRSLRANVIALATAADLLKIPIITTASEPHGPNGPLIAEIGTWPSARFVPRSGEISAWDAPAFSAAVSETGAENLIIAGVWTSVCVAFPAIAAVEAGYAVHAVIDASGDVSAQVTAATQARLVQHGVIPSSTNSVIGELQGTWNRPDAAAFAEIYGSTTPNFAAVTESYIADR